MFRDLIIKSRSFRRWRQDEAIDTDTLEEFVDLARLSCSAANRMALKYVISNDSETNALIYASCRLDNTPVAGERPAAYIVILEDQNIRMALPCDYGITAQTIMLAATEKGLGGVMIGACDFPSLAADLGLPSHLPPILVLALGTTIEEQIIETVGEDGNTQQWWETPDIRHVPKRPMDDVLVDYPKKP